MSGQAWGVDWRRMYQRRSDRYLIQRLEHEVTELKNRLSKMESDAREGRAIASNAQLSENLYGMMISQLHLQMDSIEQETIAAFEAALLSPATVEAVAKMLYHDDGHDSPWAALKPWYQSRYHGRAIDTLKAALTAMTGAETEGR